MTALRPVAEVMQNVSRYAEACDDMALYGPLSAKADGKKYFEVFNRAKAEYALIEHALKAAYSAAAAAPEVAHVEPAGLAPAVEWENEAGTRRTTDPKMAENWASHETVRIVRRAAGPTPRQEPAAPSARITAKPLEWTESSGEWSDKHFGFYVMRETDPTDADKPWSAALGEGDSEDFATLEEAKAWCQQQAEHWVSAIAHLTGAAQQDDSKAPAALQTGLPPEGRHVLAYLETPNHPHYIAVVAWQIDGLWWTGLAGARARIGNGRGVGFGYSVRGWIDCVRNGASKDGDALAAPIPAHEAASQGQKPKCAFMTADEYANVNQGRRGPPHPRLCEWPHCECNPAPAQQATKEQQ